MQRLTQEQATAQADEVLAIVRGGGYTAPSGARVALRERLVTARAGTVAWPPDRDPPRPRSSGRTTRIVVERRTTLDAANALVRAGKRPAALNFANATTPGGGFVIGALAQEESLCRASGLFACLLGNPMYAFHEARDDALYTDYVLYSPDVPVFRGEDGRLLEAPWPLSFLTAAAPFATLHRMASADAESDLEPAFRSRIPKVLGVAAHHGHGDLVLGAWGCGAFGNDPAMVAECFRDALQGDFAGVFDEVVFAITDSTPDARVIRPFEAAFGG